MAAPLAPRIFTVLRSGGFTLEDLPAAQARALELTDNLRNLVTGQENLKVLSTAQQQELDDVRSRLEQAQGEVARLTGARGIYTVQEEDSLSSIAARSCSLERIRSWLWASRNSCRCFSSLYSSMALSRLVAIGEGALFSSIIK